MFGFAARLFVYLKGIISSSCGFGLPSHLKKKAGHPFGQPAFVFQENRKQLIPSRI